MKRKTKRICLWSGPRNISTALMYSFAQRKDTKVYDEPLYAHYLRNTDAKDYHPGSDEILSTMENDGELVVQMIMGEHSKSIAFFKHMTHHLVNLNFGFFGYVDHVILTRDPREMLPSYAEAIKKPTLKDVGYKQQVDLIDYLDKIGKSYIVVDSKSILLDPTAKLRELCFCLDISFSSSMLRWEPGARSEDGCWAQYWYEKVHSSSGFNPYEPKTGSFPEHLQPLLDECLPYYNRLVEKAI